MIPDTRTPEQIRQAFNWGRPFTHCPGCGEFAGFFDFSRLDSFSRPFGDDYPATGISIGYCPNCDAFLEAWGRGKGDGTIELGCRRWRWNSAGTSMETADALFEESAPSEWRVGRMTEIAQERRDNAAEKRWLRQLSGPRYREDDPLYTVSIPRNMGDAAELESVIARICQEVKDNKAGRLKKREDLPDRVELNFKTGQFFGSTTVLNMWGYGEIPASVTVWRYNEGRRYPVGDWDPEHSRPAIHPSLLPPEERPVRPPPEVDARQRPLKKKATVEEALDWLCQTLGQINTLYSELTDTAIRDAMFDVFKDGFLQPKEGVQVPRSYGMNYKAGDLRIHRAFTSFFKIATPAADTRQLSTQQRLDMVNARPFDEFFGYCEKLPGDV